MREKIQKFIDKHGYTLKAYWLSVLIFPPAALYIACKKPGWTILQRVLGNLVPIAFIAVMPFVGTAMILRGYEFVVSLFAG